MEGIIDAFGIDTRLIIIQLFNFGILMLVLVYFFYKPVLKILKDREDKISQGLKDAEMAAKARADSDIERQSIISQAHKEAEAIVQRAKVVADNKASEVLAMAQVKASHILEEAEQKGVHIKAEAKRDSEKEVAKVAVLMAEKILRERA